MKELWLNFKDEKGEAKRVLVEGEKFLIGRTPDNDLQIPLNNLSRQHAKIERFADVFVISDCGSSNGSSVNGEPLKDPVALKNGDKLNLGDAIEIEIEVPSDEEKDAKGGVSPAPGFDDGDDESSAASSASSAGSSSSASASSSSSASGSSSSGGGSSSLWLLLLAPIFLVLVLLGLGGAILIAKSKKEKEVVINTEPSSTPNDDFPDDKKTPEEKPTQSSTPVSGSDGNSGGTSTPTTSPINSIPANSPSTTQTPEGAEVNTTTQKLPQEGERIKFASAEFMRRIAFNDPRIFLLDKQIVTLSGKINQFKGSGALADNIKNAKKNSSQIVTMAQSKNLKPQFLANAALTKLGNQRGDVVATAQSMLETLDSLSIVFGNELADDNLLVIASYEKGVAGKTLEMRDKVAGLTKKFPNVRSQTIRTIWFLKENNEISTSEFDFALQFLAIGTITQNPKDFNVSAEALKF